ncbi:hypothetical protein [Mesorhizobium sp. f-mel]
MGSGSKRCSVTSTCASDAMMVVRGRRSHPRVANVNHKIPHKGDKRLFFDLNNTESVCQTCHSNLVQKEEARGYTIGSDINGRPIDTSRPWNSK